MILNLFRTSFLCIIMLQFKLNHKRTRVLTHVKDRKHLSSKCICCLSIVLNIRFYIYKMVLYYYNTIFQKNTMSYQKSSLVWGGWGIFPSFIHELFCHIWLGSNRMQLRFLEGQKIVSVHVAVAEWREQFMFFHCHVFHLVSLAHRKHNTVEYRNDWIMQNVTNSDEFTFWIMSLLKESLIIVILRNWNTPLTWENKSIISGCD